jgi:uncharacterized protein YcbK (DUF882 family)
MSKLFKHYSNYIGPWPWKNFSARELACKHCGEFYLDEESMDALQDLRKLWGNPIIINSGHRCLKHNAKVGGTPGSQHLKIAFDCVCLRPEQDDFSNMAKEAGFTGIGLYPARGFVHLDMGPYRNWRG